MHYAFYIAAALFTAGFIAASDALAGSSIQQSIVQNSNSDSSTVIRQSSSSSTIVNNSTISSRVQSSTGNLQIDQDLSGKIASSVINLTSGDIEGTLFGDWSLNSTGFAADFTHTPVDGGNVTEYEMAGSQLHSIQEVNDSLAMLGTIDVTSNSTTAIQDAPVAIMIHDGTLVIGFERGTEASELFGGIPIIGIEQ
jgi:hypothetical protein